MLMSIKLLNKVNINIDKFGKFILNNNKMSVKEVPFVRYAFESYDDSTIAYMKSVIELFKFSGHLIEVGIAPGYIETIEKIRENIPNAAVFVYVDITDINVMDNDIDIELKELLRELKGYNIVDRLMLKDRSKSLHMVSANKIKESIYRECGIKVSDIGICSSPLSFGEQCCLTAERARELATKYSESMECVLPTANHEGTNTCGCIRYVCITEDIKAPDLNRKVPTQSAKKEKKEINSTEKKEKAKKLPKNVMMRW